jgi:hypothetical protein
MVDVDMGNVILFPVLGYISLVCASIGHPAEGRGSTWEKSGLYLCWQLHQLRTFPP